MSFVKILIVSVFLCVVEGNLNIFIADTPIERIGTRMYKKILLTDRYQSPKELTYDSSSRNLFFMFMDDTLQNSGRAYVNIVTKDSKKVKGIARNKATAVDSETGEVYFGSDNGLYKYDPVNNNAKNIALYNMNIMKLVIRNNEMYLLDANDHMIYKVYNEFNIAVKAGNLKTVMLFEIDMFKNVHVVTMCGVYCANRGFELIKNKDLKVVYHFLVSDTNTYGINDDGIFLIDCGNGTATKVGDLNFVPDSITFGDYGDIFYSERDSIYRLKPISSYIVYNLHKKT